MFGYAVLATWTLKGRVETIQALAVSWFFTMLHPSLSPATEAALAGNILVLIAAIVSWALRWLQSRRSSASIGRLSLLLVVLGIHAGLASSVPEISLAKTALWGGVLLAVLSTWESMSATERAIAERNLFGLLFVVAVASVPLVPLDIGWELNGRGFQGLFSHPQAFGVAMAFLAVWSLGQYLSTRRPPWFLLASFGLAMLLLLLSGARTGAVSVGVGTVAAASVLLGFYRGRCRELMPGLFSPRALWGAAGLALAVLTFRGDIGEWIFGFVTKGAGEVGSIQEIIYLSRGLMLDRMWANIRADPWIGVGFGLPSDPSSMEVLRDPWLSLPISAPTEKGMAWLGIIEEVGLPIAGLFYWWLFAMIRRSACAGISALAMVMSLLVVSSFESIFFSPNGMGLLAILLFGWAATANPIARRALSSF